MFFFFFLLNIHSFIVIFFRSMHRIPSLKRFFIKLKYSGNNVVQKKNIESKTSQIAKVYHHFIVDWSCIINTSKAKAKLKYQIPKCRKKEERKKNLENLEKQKFSWYEKICSEKKYPKWWANGNQMKYFTFTVFRILFDAKEK